MWAASKRLANSGIKIGPMPFLCLIKPVFHLATLFAEFIVGISELNLDEILTIILLKSPFILTNYVEVYFQLFTQTQELSENIGFSRTRAAHQDSMLF